MRIGYQLLENYQRSAPHDEPLEHGMGTARVDSADPEATPLFDEDQVPGASASDEKHAPSSSSAHLHSPPPYHESSASPVLKAFK